MNPYQTGFTHQLTSHTDPGKNCFRSKSHRRIRHNFLSYLLTCEVYLIEVLEIMAQMLQYIIFLSLKAIKVSSDFILNYLKKVVGGATTQKYQKQMLKP